MCVKYYVYVSDAKVDMVYPQIPPTVLGRISAELKIDLGYLSASVQPKDREVTRYSKLKVVANYIEGHSDVGTVHEPREYFKGTLDARSLAYSYMAFFGGRLSASSSAAEETIVGLCGNVRHLIGSDRYCAERDVKGLAKTHHYQISSSNAMFAHVLHDVADAELTLSPGKVELRRISRETENRNVIETERKELASLIAEGGFDGLSPERRERVDALLKSAFPFFRTPSEDDMHQSLLDGVRRATGCIRAPVQRYEFLARTLLRGEIGGDTVLLGTPFYVALAAGESSGGGSG